MSKITIPIQEVQIGGSLFNWYYDNAVLRSDVSKITTDTQAIATDNFKLSILEVNNILTAGGEVEEYLMAIRAPISIMGTNVPNSLPNYSKLNDTASLAAKEFSDWLVPGAEIWLKEDNLEVLFYTNPFAGNTASYLKGSEIKNINDLSAQVTCLTISDAQIETATGWTKL